MQWIQAHATTENILLLLGAVSALANVVRALAPNGSATAKAADKVLALTVDAHKLLGTAAHADAPSTSIPLPEVK